MSPSNPAPEKREHLGEAVLEALRGALHIVGMVKVAAGITKFFAIATIKAADAVEDAVRATEDEEEKPEPRTRSTNPRS